MAEPLIIIFCTHYLLNGHILVSTFVKLISLVENFQRFTSSLSKCLFFCYELRFCIRKFVYFTICCDLLFDFFSNVSIFVLIFFFQSIVSTLITLSLPFNFLSKNNGTAKTMLQHLPFGFDLNLQKFIYQTNVIEKQC